MGNEANLIKVAGSHATLTGFLDMLLLLLIAMSAVAQNPDSANKQDQHKTTSAAVAEAQPQKAPSSGPELKALVIHLERSGPRVNGKSVNVGALSGLLKAEKVLEIHMDRDARVQDMVELINFAAREKLGVRLVQGERT